MDKYKDSIYYMLLKMVNNNDDAEDLTLEAFGKAFNRLHQYTQILLLAHGYLKLLPITVLTFFVKRRKM